MGAKLKYILGPPTTLYEPNTYIPDMSLTLKYVRVHSMADPRVAAKSGVLSKNDLKLIQVKTRTEGTHLKAQLVLTLPILSNRFGHMLISKKIYKNHIAHVN